MNQTSRNADSTERKIVDAGAEVITSQEVLQRLANQKEEKE